MSKVDEYTGNGMIVVSDGDIMLFDEDDEELYDDQTLVDNTEYHSERALVKAVAKKYGISEDIITVL